jgi:type I restriction enzyme M protein
VADINRNARPTSSESALSAQNELRPQDVMRMLVHYHAYGDAAKVPALVAEHSGRIREQIDLREEDEVGRLQAEYQTHVDRLAAIDAEITATRAKRDAARTKGAKAVAEAALAKLERPRERLVIKVAERDERIVEARRRAEDDRRDVANVGDELVALYTDPDELLKHARVVNLDEIEENEFNLNIPRYVDTFEPEPRIEVEDAMRALLDADAAAESAGAELAILLAKFGFLKASNADA